MYILQNIKKSHDTKDILNMRIPCYTIYVHTCIYSTSLIGWDGAPGAKIAIFLSFQLAIIVYALNKIMN